VGVEILEEQSVVDYLFIASWRWRLKAQAWDSHFTTENTAHKIIGAERKEYSINVRGNEGGYPVTLSNIDQFVDSATVGGDIAFLLQEILLDDLHLIPEGKLHYYF